MWRISSAQARPGLSEAAAGPTSHFLRFRSQKQTVCLALEASSLAGGIENTLEAFVREVANFLQHSSSQGEERLTAKKKKARTRKYKEERIISHKQ